MPNRDNLEAAHARIAALEREKGQSESRAAELERKLALATEENEEEKRQTALAVREAKAVVKKPVGDERHEVVEYISKVRRDLDELDLAAAVEREFGLTHFTRPHGHFRWQEEDSFELVASLHENKVTLEARFHRPRGKLRYLGIPLLLLIPAAALLGHVGTILMFGGCVLGLIVSALSEIGEVQDARQTMNVRLERVARSLN